jgi:hypothetical protein
MLKESDEMFRELEQIAFLKKAIDDLKQIPVLTNAEI